MQKKFFCARNVKDYMAVTAEERAAIKSSVITARDILSNEYIQGILYAHTNFYGVREEGCDSAIKGATGIDGLHLDFNFGLRLDVPAGNFHVTISDYDSGMIFLDEDLSDVRLISVEKYFIRWQVKISHDGTEILNHVLNLEGQQVMIVMTSKAMGDALAVLPFASEFKRRHGCKMSILLPEYLRGFAAALYPELVQADAISFDGYANYFPVMLVSDYPKIPVDLRSEPMERITAAILGLETLPAKPHFKPTAPPVTNEPYICIGVQASSNRKAWLYPGGWDVVVDYLKRLGYRVFCIDKHAAQTNMGITISKPDGAEDFTGDFPIMDRANMLYHAEFFIGLGSGLAWIANAVDCPVVMICGFSQDWCEFYTPYRVANRLVCNGCFNDVRVKYLRSPCPYHYGTSRALECQRKISPQMVIDAINQLRADKNFA